MKKGMRKLPNGTYEYRHHIDGVRLHSYGRTQREAEESMGRKVDALRRGLPTSESTTRLGDYLSEWARTTLPNRATPRSGRPLKASTRANYLKLLEHVVGRDGVDPDPIARVRLSDLKPLHVEGFMTRLGDSGLSASTRRTTYHVIRLALDHAVENDLIARNPAHKVPRPLPEQDERRHLTPAELVKLLEAARGYRYHEAVSLIAATGLRRGEALALKWEDVDLLTGTVTVKGTLNRIGGKLVVTAPKSDRSKRTVYLSPGLVDLLATWKDRQERERAHAANVWNDTGFVFTTETGEPVDGRNLLRTISWAAKKAGLNAKGQQRVNVHTLRHSYLSALANAGQPIAILQQLAGHSDIRITQSYLHSSDDEQRRVGVSIAPVLGL